MSMDAFSPTAPARVRTLVLPIGRIKRTRFSSFFNQLTPACEVRLGDVSPDSRPNRNMFSPLAFPNGVVLYDFTTALTSSSHLALSPFEAFREPLAILGIADSTEFSHTANGHGEPGISAEPNGLIKQLSIVLEGLQESYPRTLIQKIMLFDSLQSQNEPSSHQNIIFVPPVSQQRITTMKTIMCDVTSVLLAEMTTLAISIQALPSIASPSSNSPANGPSSNQWYNDETPGQTRPSSQTGERPLSASPAVNLHRMSLPVLPSSGPNMDSSTEISRTTTPESGYSTPPAKTFDEISSGESKASPASISRHHSRDRVSVHGFGPGSINERNRNKGKSRVALVIGSLYLQAGRWNDALRELCEGATKARSFSDHLWHAKALENVMLCMVLLAWSRVDFTIPQICYPTLERASGTRGTQPKTPTSNREPISNGNVTDNQVALRQELATVLPDLVNMIISIYIRAANFAGEHIPQIAFSESIIRCSKILASINLAGGALNDVALESIIRGTHMEPSLVRTRLTITPTRTTITNILYRAMPGPIEHSGLSATDQMLILGGVASVLSSIGLQRKKAIILKEYLDTLIQALALAKKTGAAEAGLHPSASLVNPGNMTASGLGDAPEGLEDFLNLLCQVYGIAESRWSNSIGSEALEFEAANASNVDSKIAKRQSHLPTQLVGNFVLRFFGSVNVKADVLRTCIQLCEALSDLHGVLHYTSALLRTAGPGIAPSSDTSDVLVTLSREEQISLANNITKTIADAESLGLKGVEAEYWDEFLVRGVYIVGPPESLILHSHKHSDIGSAKNLQQVEKQSPFIHNPFLEKADIKADVNLLVAGDEREFVISLQNPYDFQVKIESIRLESEGVEVAVAKNLVLRPYRTQSFSATGIVGHPGHIELESCVIKIQGCRERSFPIFSEPWAPDQDIKIKNIGLLRPQSQSSSRLESDVSTSSGGRQSSAKPFPIPSSVSLNVIPEQPILVVSAVSLAQSALMLLEGEIAAFSITVQNTSKTVAADFIHISFRDSTTTAILEALGNKRLSPAELFELEYQLSHHPAIRACDDVPTTIQPGHTETLRVEVVGKPGLTSAVIQIDYANISIPGLEKDDVFFTRHVTVPVSVTVNASVQLHRMEIIPISANVSRDPQASQSESNGIAGLSTFHSPSKDEYCLLLLDLRNAWPTPLEIELHVSNQSGTSEAGSTLAALSSRDTIQPGHVSRMILLLPKIYVKHPHARIRATNERQFVVSTNNISPESERVSREIFWYREEFLKMIRGSWKQEGGGTAGTIDLRSIFRFNSRMVDVLKLDDLAIEMSVYGDSTDDAAEIVHQTGQSSFKFNVLESVTLRTTIRNRSDATIYPLLRLRPSLAHQPNEMALDLVKRLTWTGLLQRALPPLHPGETIATELGICAFSSGEYEIGAHVEEVTPCGRAVNQDDNGKGVGSIPDQVAGTVGRRTWTASEACRIFAIED